MPSMTDEAYDYKAKLEQYRKRNQGARHRGCKAQPGQLHEPGCCVERCARCGGQFICCGCVYELNGMDRDALSEEHPDIYKNGATDEMEEVFSAEIERIGGRIPCGEFFPGTEDAIRLNFWTRWVEGQGWVKCDADHPDAGPGLNELAEKSVWNRERRRYELPGESSN